MLLCSILHRLVSWALTHHFPFPLRRGCCWLIQPCALSPCREAVLAKFLLTSPNVSKLMYIYMVPVACWNIPSRRTDCYKISLIRKYLLKSALFKISLTVGEKGWGGFASSSSFHNLNGGLSVYYWMHRWARFLPGLSAYGAGSHSSHRSTSVHERMPS